MMTEIKKDIVYDLAVGLAVAETCEGLIDDIRELKGEVNCVDGERDLEEWFEDMDVATIMISSDLKHEISGALLNALVYIIGYSEGE